MSGGFLYFYRTYTATASGSRTKRERCAGCSCVFEYVIRREVQGGGHSAFYSNNAGAEAIAKIRARANLSRALDEAIELVHCPACGIYQPDMVQVLRERHGKRYEPNKHASERIAVPVASAWRAACATNTVASYTKFIEVWPTFHWQAKKQIKELRYPPYMQKLVAALGWVLWGSIALCIIGVVISTMK
jgi:hypothetical protein